MSEPGRPGKRSIAYENKLVAVLTLTFGVVMVDRLALNFLAPFVVRDLGLSNTQLGTIATVLSASLALSGIVVGRLCDRYGRRKLILCSAVIGFSFSSFLSGLAPTYATLLLARGLLGLFEGPVLPISHVLLARASSPHRRGFNMGVMQMFGSNVLGTLVTPILMVAVAGMAGWRAAFYVAGAPGLLCALLVWITLRDIDDAPSAPRDASAGGMHGWLEILKTPTIWLCTAISGLMVGWVLLSFVFLPLIITGLFGKSASAMGLVMSVVGVSAVISGFVVPALSDRYGRKPVIALAAAVGFISPVGVWLSGGSLLVLSIALFLGFLVVGLTPIVIATIPAETVDPRHVTTAVGLVIGMGEVVAGLAGPLLGGVLADRYGLLATLGLQAALLTMILLLSRLLPETAPSRHPTRPGGFPTDVGSAPKGR